MSIKKRILMSVCWLALMMCCGFAVLRSIWLDGTSIQNRQSRAGRAGSAFATISAVGIGGLWFPWAYQFGKQKRAERDLASKNKPRHSDNNPAKKRPTQKRPTKPTPKQKRKPAPKPGKSRSSRKKHRK